MFLTQEHRFFRNEISRFVTEQVIPRAHEIDSNDEFPLDLFREVGQLGYFGIRYPEEYGGSEADVLKFSKKMLWKMVL